MPLNIPGQPPPVDGAPDGHSQHPARGSEGGRSCRRRDDKPRQAGTRATAARYEETENSEPEIRWNIIALLREMPYIEEKEEQWVTLWRNQQLGIWMEFSRNKDSIFCEPLEERKLHHNASPSTQNVFCQKKMNVCENICPRCTILWTSKYLSSTQFPLWSCTNKEDTSVYCLWW